jgi:monofunctional biosynthetic peptidoglycan transglycosylase
VLVLALLPVGWWVACLFGLVYLKFLPPVITGLQLQRVVERTLAGDDPVRTAEWMPLDEISTDLARAVVAAEDARFYTHGGFDWEEIRAARDEARREGEPLRGASTLTHQLIKNLYFTTHRNPIRKLYEWTLTPPAEWILGKDRILELYLNVVEFGPGRFGAEAAAQHHFGVSAADLTRRQAMGLAAILPAPLRRRPADMGWYVEIIDGRMRQIGW